ncbi:MAG: conserved membrane protein of unknown function [Candidatus Thorarchaeota archaeon]|nr:MAG: conserved membrane protein of unknown function [Candidatus Thorarchaeota archaeon]
MSESSQVQETRENKPDESMSTHDGPQKALYAWIGGLIFALGFTILIWLLGPLLEVYPHLPDQGATWYYWQLPARDDVLMLVTWVFYLSHQFAIWGAIYWAQKNLKEFRATPTRDLTKYNYMAIIINVVFIVLHLVQTHLWYDGLAQDVPIWTSQGSVIVMLSVILIIENPRRGFFLGKKAGKPMTARVVGFFRRTHTYIFAWALVYTFWFHPMDSDPQLLTGFFYMFLLFTQISLAYTTVHVDKRWIVLLEYNVAFHGAVVAVFNTAFFNSAEMWPMFFSGFTFMFVFTYMYAFDVRREIRWLVMVLYFAFLAWLYLPLPFGFGRDPMKLMMLEFLWIPIVLYGLSIVLAALAFLYLRIRNKK